MSKKNRDAARKVREMQAAQKAQEKRRQTLIVSGAAVLVIAIVVGIAIAVQSSRDSTPTTVSAAGTPTGVVDSYGIARGDADAPVTLTVYEDFQCPICRQFEGWLGDTIKQEVDAGTLQVVYRPIAFLDRMSTTDYSSRALETAACVLDEDGPDTFLKLHELLFANQPAENTAGLTDADLAGLAEQAGATKAAVESCQDAHTFDSWAKAATDQASKDKVQGTPTFRINGDDVPVTSAQDQASAVQALTDAIAAAQAG